MTKTNSLKLVPFLDGRMLDYVSGATKDYQPTLSKPTWLQNEDGSMKTEPTAWGSNAWVRGEPILGEWKPNDPFRASMKWQAFIMARAAGRVWVSDRDTDIRYPMFIHDFDKIAAGQTSASLGTTESGQLVIFGTWQAVKKGANFGIMVVE